MDRRDVFATRVDLIRQFAAETGAAPKIVELYSWAREWPHGVADVRRAVREAGCQYAAQPHVVLIITHEALKSSDLSTYAGWTVIIDEVPTIWAHGEITSPASSVYLAASYNLLPVAGTAWSEVQAKADGALMTDLHRDTLLSPALAELHRHVRDRGVMADIQAWEDTAAGKPWSWLAMWTPEHLGAFNAVYLLGNAFEHTLTCKLLQTVFDGAVKLVPFALPNRSALCWRPRALLIRYFARSHRAGTTFWRDSEHGRECLRRIPWWINANTDAENHYWSCNIGLLSAGPSAREIIGQKVSPKIAGVNSLSGRNCGTFIYSAKPSDREREAFAMFGVSADEIVRSREQEDLIQMLWRSSLRDPDDSRMVEFRVYDWWQAEFLREFVEQTAPHVTVSVEQVDLGLDAFQPRPRGRPVATLSQAEQQAKAERVREQARERQRRRRANAR